MEPTLFVITGAGIFAMVALRMLEIKYERCIGLAHVSMRVDKRIKPYAKKLSRVVNERIDSLKVRMEEVPVRVKSHVGGYVEKGKTSWGSHYEFLAESFRGKRALSKGSVSFFLLNISDYGRKTSAQPSLAEENLQPVVIRVSDLEETREVVENV